MFVACISLQAQTTQEQADAIVLTHIQSVVTQPYTLYFNTNSPSENGIEITTMNAETVKMQYLCYAYCLVELPAENEPARCRYLFVKVNNANLLELITDGSNPNNPEQWKLMLGVADVMERTVLPYPNPVNDWITIPATGVRTFIEIYDIKGICVLSETLSEQNEYQLNISFLNAGIYMLKVYDETNNFNYKIIKN